MPHLLVAGSTGSGKSVALNVMIISIMYHYSPEFVRFIMVDPKKVELSVYKDMPHMLMPSTVTETDKAVNALNWAVNEMERRYQLLGENGCRNLPWIIQKCCFLKSADLHNKLSFIPLTFTGPETVIMAKMTTD